MTNLQELMNDMMESPITIYVCIVHYDDGSQRAFTFSCEELLQEFIEYITDAGERLNMVSYVFYQSLLDASCDADYNMFTTIH